MSFIKRLFSRKKRDEENGEVPASKESVAEAARRAKKQLHAESLERRRKAAHVQALLRNPGIKKTQEFWVNLTDDQGLLESLPIKDLRRACQARGLEIKGKKFDLIGRIEQSVIDEKEDESLEELQRIQTQDREVEAQGSVYTFGSGRNGQLGHGTHRRHLKPHCVITLRGKRVRRVFAGKDVDVCFALTEDDDVLGWGFAQDAPLLGFVPVIEKAEYEEKNDDVVEDKSESEYETSDDEGNVIDSNDPEEIARREENAAMQMAMFQEVLAAYRKETGRDPTPEELEAILPDEMRGMATQLGFEVDETSASGMSSASSMSASASASAGAGGGSYAYEDEESSEDEEEEGELGTQPILMENFRGEEIDDVYIARTHCIARSRGGDLFVWGLNGYKQLGLSDEHYDHNPDVQYLDDGRENPNWQPQRLASYQQGTTWTRQFNSDGTPNPNYRPNAGEFDYEMFMQKKVTHGSDGERHIVRNPGLLAPMLMRLKPTLLDTIPRDERIIDVGASMTTSYCVSEAGNIYVWGTSAGTTLGLKSTGITDRDEKGRDIHSRSVILCTPTLIPAFNKLTVKQVSVGYSHTVALCSDGVYSWGSGDGGRLGHGDSLQTITPKRIEAFDTDIVLSVHCGTFHNCAIVLVPPMFGECGALYTWGSGSVGQLAQGHEQFCPTPKMVQYFADMDILIKKVACGIFHNVAMTNEGKFYSWGSNIQGALGRPDSLQFEGVSYKIQGGEDVLYQLKSRPRDVQGLKGTWTPIPGLVEGFDEWGKGVGRDVAVGRSFTIIVLHAWEGPPEEDYIAEKEAKQERKQQKEEKARREAAEHAAIERQARADDRKRMITLLNKYHPICSICANTMPYDKCPGFKAAAFNPNICEFCEHDRSKHRKKRDLGDTKLTNEALEAEQTLLFDEETFRMIAREEQKRVAAEAAEAAKWEAMASDENADKERMVRDGK